MGGDHNRHTAAPTERVPFGRLFVWINSHLYHIRKEAKMAAITISRQYGSSGDEIAERVCQELGYRHV